MARYLQIPATVTDPGAGVTPWSLGITGFSHRWDPTLLTDPVGSNILTLPDKIGTTDLVAAASGTKTLTADAAGFNYLSVSSGGTLGYQPSPAGTAGLTSGFTVVMVAKIGAGTAIFAQAGGYAFDFGGNGKINVYNYGTTTTSIPTASNGTGWHIIVARLDGANTRITVDGVHYPAASFTPPTSYKNLYYGGGTNSVNLAPMLIHPTVLSDADSLTVHNAVKAELAI